MSQLLEQMPVTGALLRPVANVADILVAQEEATRLVSSVLKEGVDFGKIPGAGDKPTLLKPGAERLLKAFGCAADFSIEEREADHMVQVPWSKRKKVWNNKFKGDKSFTWAEEEGHSYGLYRYVVKCSLIYRQTGEVVGTGIGVCSTLESKYVDRPRDCENTVLKMAEKRAMVAATLISFGLSDRFTQDVEDIRANERVHDDQPIDAEFRDEPKRESRATAAPEGKDAFGYIPVRWPLAKMFDEPITDSQRNMIAGKTSERSIPEEDVNEVRRLVFEAYRLTDEPTKAHASIFVDWLINAEEPHLDAAVEAAEELRIVNEPLELEA